VLSFFLSNAAAERLELPRIVADREELIHNVGNIGFSDIDVFRFDSRPFDHEPRAIGFDAQPDLDSAA
jgi:hypothetical protein